MNKVLFFNFMKKKFRGKFEKITNQFLTHLIKMILKIKTRKLFKVKWRLKKAFLILFVINLNKE